MIAPMKNTYFVAVLMRMVQQIVKYLHINHQKHHLIIITDKVFV